MLVLSFLISIVVLQRNLIETKSLLPEAVSYAIGNSFNDTAEVLHIVIETDLKESTVSFLDTLQSILEIDWTLRIQIDVNNEIGQTVSDHNLWFIDSYKAFQRLLQWIRAYRRDSQLFHFIILRTSKFENHYLLVMQRIFSDFLKHAFGNLNILVENSSAEVLFYTFYPYKENACRSADPFLIFRFQNSEIEHKPFSFFPSKVNNFHGCPLRIKTRNELVLILGNYDIPNTLSSREMSLLEVAIIKELSFMVNCSFDINNITIDDHFETLTDEQTDVMFGSHSVGPKEKLSFSTSVTYFVSWLVIALQRRPNLLRTLVWLFVPFNSTTWTCVFGFLALTSGCLALVRKSKKLISIFHLENSGGLDVLSVTIGASVGHLPRRNCLRFAFIVMSLAALILRSAYLGKLFDAYRGFPMIKSPRSVLELLAENYTIYAHDIYIPIIEELLGLQNIHFEDLKPYQGSFNILSDIEKRNAFVVSFIYIYTFYTAEQRKDMILKTVLRQQVCMFFPQHSIIVPKVNEIIMKMEESGILHHVRRNYENFDHNTLSLEDKMLKPIPLVLERFAFTFYLFGMLNVISILVFFVELFWKRSGVNR